MYKKRITCPEIVYLKGEEMTRYTMDLFLQKCILPHINIDKWHFYDLDYLLDNDTQDGEGIFSKMTKLATKADKLSNKAEKASNIADKGINI